MVLRHLFQNTAMALAILLPTGMVRAQEVPEMKMTTELPEGLTTFPTKV